MGGDGEALSIGLKLDCHLGRGSQTIAITVLDNPGRLPVSDFVAAYFGITFPTKNGWQRLVSGNYRSTP